MSHVNINMPAVPHGKRAVLNCGSFDRGVAFCEYDRELYDGQSPYMKNMIYDKNMLRTRFGQCSVDIGELPRGKVHSCCHDIFFGHFVFHIGDSIYSFDGEKLDAITQGLPDCASFVFEMNSQLYFFCKDVRIFIVDKDLQCSEYIIPETKIMSEAKYDLSDYNKLEIPDNMIMFRLSIDYIAKDNGFEYFRLPCECDTGYPIIIKSIETGEIYNAGYTVEKDIVHLEKELFSAYNVSFVPAKGSGYRDFDKIFGCTVTCVYGGESGGGTRVFFAGNYEYPGYYFHSELLSPLEVKKLSYDILGNGSMKIRCLAKQKSDLIAFCDRSVYRIKYTFNDSEGPDFIVSEVSTRIGCDIPESVQLIDNRLVFANSQSGIHIIVSSEYTDELSIRRISANINGIRGKNGFLKGEFSDVGFASVDFDRKYMLICPGGNAYVWDYGNSPYIVGDNPLASERRLCWYFFDGLYENMLFEICGKLYGTENVDGNTDFVLLSDDTDTDFGESIHCVYRSRNFDFEKSFSKKVPEELYLNASGDAEMNMVIKLYCDGRFITQRSFSFAQKDEDKLKRLYMKIPGYETYRMSFSLETDGGRAGIYDAQIGFKSKEIYYR